MRLAEQEAAQAAEIFEMIRHAPLKLAEKVEKPAAGHPLRKTLITRMVIKVGRVWGRDLPLRMSFIISELLLIS